MGRRGRKERDGVESRESRSGRDLRSRKSPDLRLKVEGQPKRSRIQRPDKLPEKFGAPTESGQADGAGREIGGGRRGFRPGRNLSDKTEGGRWTGILIGKHK